MVVPPIPRCEETTDRMSLNSDSECEHGGGASGSDDESQLKFGLWIHSGVT